MTPEFSRIVNLARLPPEGREVRLVANAAECAALARRFGILGVDRLEAILRLRPEPGGLATIAGRLSAEVVQACVVTLEPVVQAVGDEVGLRVIAAGEPSSEDPEAPDEIEAEGDSIDLGEAMAEQLALALDPYPRAAGASLPGGEGEEPPPSGPFAGLAALRKRG